jgi:hypothetical protein
MRASVLQQFSLFSARFEGREPMMYLDTHHPDPLVTTGVGNLIDPMELALNLPWVDALSGAPASQGEIMTEWSTVKSLTAHSGGPTSFWGMRAKLRLKPQGIDQLVNSKLLEFEAILKTRPCFNNWENFPADAQLGILSMSWAMGAEFNYPKFCQAASLADWATCAIECYIPDQANPGLRPRNEANIQLFQNAAIVARKNLDPSILYYPRTSQ